jgi:hypothetical protein
MAQGGNVLKYESRQKSSLSIGWKWAQFEDAEALVEEWLDNSTNVTNGKPYGQKKEQI